MEKSTVHLQVTLEYLHKMAALSQWKHKQASWKNNEREMCNQTDIRATMEPQRVYATKFMTMKPTILQRRLTKTF